MHHEPQHPPHAPSEQWGAWEGTKGAIDTTSTPVRQESIPSPVPVHHPHLPYSQPPQPPQWQPPAAQNDYLRGLAIAGVIGGILLVMITCFWLLLTIASLAGVGEATLTPEFEQTMRIIYATLTCATGTGALLTLYHCVRSLLQKPSAHVGLLRSGSWLSLYCALVLTSYGLQSIRLYSSLPPFLQTLAPVFINLLPVLAIIALAAQWLPIPHFALTWRRTTMALVCGGIFSFHLTGVILLSVFNTLDAGGSLCFTPMCAGTPEGTQSFLFLTVLIPIIDTLIKPAFVLLLIKKIHHPAEALYLGLICGAGYGYIEGTIAFALFPTNWTVITAAGIGMIAVQSVTCGLLLLGWYHLFHRSPSSLVKTVGFWLATLLLHIIVYASLALFLLPGFGLDYLSKSIRLGSLAIHPVVGSIIIDVLILAVILGLAVRYIRRTPQGNFTKATN